MGGTRQEVRIPLRIDMVDLINLGSQKFLHPLRMNIKDINVITGRVTIRDIGQLALTVHGNPRHGQSSLGDSRISGFIIGLSQHGDGVWITCPDQIFRRSVKNQYPVFRKGRRKQSVISIIQADGPAAAELTRSGTGRIRIKICLANNCERLERPDSVDTETSVMLPGRDATTMKLPMAVEYDDSYKRLFVADTWNNRVPFRRPVG